MSSSDSGYVLIEEPASCVRVVRLNRPDMHNAISTDLLREIAEALASLDDDPGVRVTVLTGSRKVFAAGADINEIRERGSVEGLSDPRPGLWHRIRSTRMPVIGAVEGWCLGAGNELAMCADLIIAGRTAKFGQPETNLGLIPGAGGGAVLSRLIGPIRAMEMVLTGRPITAEQAKEYGLVNCVTPAGEALETAVELATGLARRSPLALQQAKAVIRHGAQSSLESHLAMERQAFSLVLSSEDKATGIEAFLNKQDPEFKGC